VRTVQKMSTFFEIDRGILKMPNAFQLKEREKEKGLPNSERGHAMKGRCGNYREKTTTGGKKDISQGHTRRPKRIGL